MDIPKGILDYLYEFNEFKDPKEIDKERSITVFCDSGEDSGLLIDDFVEELGFNMFIAKKWIYHDELLKIMKLDK